MDRNEQLSFCKKCKHRKFDYGKGIVCGLTMQPAIFETSCSDFLLDHEKAAELEEKEKIQNIDQHLSSNGRRFATYLVDTVGMFVGAFICFLLLNFFGYAAFFDQINDNLLGLMIASVYYIFFEALFSQTPGKFVVGTLVVNEKGEKVNFAQVIGRTFCRFIPFDALSFLGNRGAGWHDKLSKTRVVNKRIHLQRQIEGVLDAL